jgi:hypothetical protein
MIRGTMKKFFYIMVVLTFSTAIAFAQSPSPVESPSAPPAKTKHKHSAKKEASPGPSESPSASPAAEKHKRSAKKEASPGPSESPSASPAATTTSHVKTGTQTEAMGTPAPGGGSGMVWVNTDTHVYHKEGSRWYGRTKKGKYMKESEAIKEGDREEKEAGGGKKKGS